MFTEWFTFSISSYSLNIQIRDMSHDVKNYAERRTWWKMFSYLSKSWRYIRKVETFACSILPTNCFDRRGSQAYSYSVISAVRLDCCLLQSKSVESCVIDQICIYTVLIMRSVFENPWKRHSSSFLGKVLELSRGACIASRMRSPVYESG